MALLLPSICVGCVGFGTGLCTNIAGENKCAGTSAGGGITYLIATQKFRRFREGERVRVCVRACVLPGGFFLMTESEFMGDDMSSDW